MEIKKRISGLSDGIFKLSVIAGFAKILKRTSLLLLLILALLFIGLNLTEHTYAQNNGFAGGSGTEEDPYLVETFVDSNYSCTCYRAANLTYLGETSGFAKTGSAFTYHGRRKSIYLYVYDEKKLKTLTNSTPCYQTLKYKRERVTNMMLHTPTWDPEIPKEVGISEEEISSLGDSLDEYLAIYRPCYARKDQQKHGETFVKGLLSNIKQKSIEPIALESVGPRGVRPLQIFFKHFSVDDEMMLHIYNKI